VAQDFLQDVDITVIAQKIDGEGMVEAMGISLYG
jgi:hypothetical protein